MEERQGIFSGVRVIELAQYVYVPGAAVMLADQGAEVIKIETLEGDPYRTLRIGTKREMGGINISMEQNNRNKKSVALDLKSDDGREALLRLIETADVFLTSLRPKAITALGLDVEDLRARNPRLIYVRGNGVGFRGAEANRPGYDASAFWARGGACHAFTRPGEQPTSPRPAYGDHTGSLALAYGIAGALFRRATTGEPSVVENSLLATACWVLSGDLSMVQMPGYATHPAAPIRRPLTSAYETRDRKRIQLMILNPAPRWRAFCQALGLDHIVDDPRFADDEARNADPEPIIAILREAFARRDLSEWKPVLEAIDVPWEVIASIEDLAADPQVTANGMLAPLSVGGTEIAVVAGPTAFDGETIRGRAAPAPALGADTAELLGEIGYSAGEIAALRTARVVL